MTRTLMIATAIALAFAVSASGCRKDGARNLPFGDRCSSDPECSSGICLFANERTEFGRCTRKCSLDRNDCPAGTACATIARHSGESTPVCGEPPPFPLGGPPPAGPEAAPGDAQ